MKIAVIQFPGSNCESESIRAIRAAGMDAEEFLLNRNPQDLSTFDGYFIVGGFSYEDRSRAGVIASLDPIMKFLRAEDAKRKPILGVCNGAQILVESGFVPGLSAYEPAMALATNIRMKDGSVLGTGFYNAWVYMKLSVPTTSSAFTCALPDNFVMRIPVAHGEGRFVIPDPLLQEMKQKNLTTFQYCTSDGDVVNEFPINPNGSVYNLAGVTNAQGNVLALMPHPERTPAGGLIFESMREYLQNKREIKIHDAFTYRPATSTPRTYQPSESATELIVESIITDNEAMTVSLTLDHLGIPVSIQRKNHWEISLNNSAAKEKTLDEIRKSSELYNPRKEKELSFPRTRESSTNALTIITRYKDDILGEEKTQVLRERYQIKNIAQIKSGIIWTITPQNPADTVSIQKALDTHIFYNQYSQEYFSYDTD